MSDIVRARGLRGTLIGGTSLGALGAAMLLFGTGAAHAQATTGVADPAASSSTVGNPNEAVSGETQKADNAAITNDVTPAQNEAVAQAAGQATADATGDAAAGDIVVTGFRRSLETAVAEKKSRDQIVESVSAEDIGKLPDASIAESIARLPGLTSQRVSGRSQVISIRGFAPDFSTTLLNGREQTSTGENRAVEFDQYPAEVMNQVLVYKSPMASIVGQGLSGTVDLRTIRPLEFGRRVLSLGARGNYSDIGKLNAESNDWGYRVNGTYVDQFMDDKIGVALSASYVDEPYQIQEFNAWGYAGVNGNSVIGGSKSYVTSTQLKRLGLSGTLEFRFDPRLTTTIDGFYSDFKDLQTKRGIELPLAFGGDFGTVFNAANSTATDGFYRSGTFNNVRGVVRNDQRNVTAKLYSFAVNNAWKGDDGWNAQMDVSFSKTDRSELSVESYSGTGFNGDNTGQGAAATIGFNSGRAGTTFSTNLDYSDPNLIRLTDPLGWGGGTIPQAGYLNDRLVEDEIQQYRVEIEKEFDEGSFFSSWQIGGNYTYHQKSLVPDEAFVRLPGGATSAVLPEEYRLRTTSLDYLGLGPVLSYRPLDLIDNGVLALVPRGIAGDPANDVFSKYYSVREDLMTLYTQLNIKAELGSSELTGNVGVQAVNTEQKSTGYTFVPSRRFETRGDDYWDVMPSINLSLRTPTDWVFRAAASRQVMRPRMVDMRQALDYGVDTSGATPIIRGSSGNPDLRPFRANAFDVNIEKYFGNKGYIALQGYYKDIKSFVYLNQEVPFDFTGFQLSPGSIIPSSFIGTLRQPINVKGGKLYGGELAATLPLGEIVSAIDGFGVTGGVSYTKTKIAPNPGAPSEDLPGYSRWTANGTAYFEKWGFSARGSVRYRSTFVGEIVGFGGDRAPRRALGETIVDAQIGYDFAADSALGGVSLFVQGQNLTDEPFRTVTSLDTPLQVIDYQTYGRRFMAGATIKF